MLMSQRIGKSGEVIRHVSSYNSQLNVQIIIIAHFMLKRVELNIKKVYQNTRFSFPVELIEKSTAV